MLFQFWVLTVKLTQILLCFYIMIILLHFLFSPLLFLPKTDDFEDSMNETKCWHVLAGFADKINIKLNVRHMP